MAGSINFFVKINPQESPEKRVSRFKQWGNRARVTPEVRKRRYRKKDLTRREEREGALENGKNTVRFAKETSTTNSHDYCSASLPSPKTSFCGRRWEVLLAHLLDVSRLELIAYSEQEVPVDKLGALQQSWAKIEDGCPVAYLTHEKEFYGLDFYVDERVLVPRGETERLVDYVLDRAQEGAKILEVGTGSGAIAVALKKTRPDLEVMASDVSSEALEIANKNIVQNGVSVALVESDLLEKVPEMDLDIIVANLPYIGEETNNFVAENVEKYEPSVALFGGSDGLQLYAKLFEQVREQERDVKFIMGEIGFTQGRDIENLTKKHLPHFSFELMQDYQDLDRHFRPDSKLAILKT